MRRLTLSLATAALALGALLGASTAAAAQEPPIPAGLCVDGGGKVVHDGTTPPIGYKCEGGRFDGFPVVL
ncbi:hypothetical protein [Streptomyces sp. WAC 06738]|uniref:hypothetical protein n=1 Tax=Streptomyces sp. WAC 06738 TaxID=2203210 RepID=UPI0019D0DF6A|nr:hypothetical protein [Streptomyces sp. WAC 06738]